MNPPGQSSIEAFHTITPYIYFLLWKLIQSSGRSTQMRYSTERPFTPEGNYLVCKILNLILVPILKIIFPRILIEISLPLFLNCLVHHFYHDLHVVFKMCKCIFALKMCLYTSAVKCPTGTIFLSKCMNVHLPLIRCKWKFPLKLQMDLYLM